MSVTSRILRPTLAALVLLASALVAGDTATVTVTVTAPVASHTGEDYDPTDADFAAMSRILDRRAAALADQDRDAWLATVDPANDDLVREEERLVDNLLALGVTLDYQLDSAGYPPDDVPGDDPVIRPPVLEKSRVRGVDSRFAEHEIAVTFVQRDGTWYVGADRPGEQSFAQPWYGDPLRVAHAGRLTVVTDIGGSGPAASALLKAVRKEIGSIAPLLGVAADDRLLVDNTASSAPPPINAFEGGDAAARLFAVWDETATGDWAVAGWRIKIHPDYVTDLLDDPSLLRHELTHFLLRRQDFASPIWVIEGIAEYVGYWPRRAEDVPLAGDVLDRLLEERRELPVDGVFGTFPELSYPEAFAAVSHLVDTWGMPKFRELMAAYRRAHAGLDSDGATPRVLRSVYGITEPQLTRSTWAILEKTPVD